MSICYVTAFLDINRHEWTQFGRTFQAYFASFTPLVDLFKQPTDNRLIVFIDKKHSSVVREYTNGLSCISIVEIDEDYLKNNSVLWSRLPRETEIINSPQYKTLIGNRPFPENHNPKYTLINHSKIDIVALATSMVDCEYFCWVDFGYCTRPQNIPKQFLDLNRLDKERINYTLINDIDAPSLNYIYVLQQSPETFGGFFFFGRRDKILEYQKLYHKVHADFQNLTIVDDDQFMALQCYIRRPDLFKLHLLGSWHKALVAFQKGIKDLTTIMNNYGSDKGNGHHNYTIYYAKLLEHMRYRKIDLLEFGIGSMNQYIPSNMAGKPGGYQPGASLRGWKEYFIEGNIYGCDIDKDILFQEDRISTFYVDQTNPSILEKQIVMKRQDYDVIVDDGLHDFAVNWNVLKCVFCMLKPGGFYIIEDICNFNPKIYDDPFAKLVNLRYFKIPNPQNNSDNNILVVRHKGYEIPDP